MSEQIDTVVRFHDVSRLVELKRCVFSLIGQSYRPLNIILTTQRFSENDVYEARQALAPLIDEEEGVTLSVVNWDQAEPQDARSELLNLGLLAARGRYLAFLDYDDVLYPEAYELLVSRLKESTAAIAFAAVRIMRLDVYERYLYTTEEIVPVFRGVALIDLLRNNFCPLHSYVIDRQQMAGGPILFDTTMTMQEDYDWLLRLCARYTSDFSLVKTRIGDYYYKTDGSNTVPTAGVITDKEQTKLDSVITAIEVQRRMTIVSETVQRTLGITEPSETATIRDVIDRVKNGV
ncbi:MAG: glycosyltransferase [Rhodospirillaceae bacterium]|jgi:hypothetical protein|nr:glycosyltransferase [Rhodospirillaceae bacterium]MBT5242283.1 glycosyltransferase [Rhodospirillaceae bacterium]MBT5566011.1 glycosyltransferase [Rhodospirillaceae bacterium]MBT6088569.1 glycosyltransferase [Rhodospirillaceae bacterium]MBT6961361.1 glycosyltransferase [Rhodospirillaceae bacterium]